MKRPFKVTKASYTDRSDGVGRYLDEVDKISMISPDEEVDLSIKKAAGDREAFDKLVTANLRFVVLVAKQYQYRGLALADLISEGNLGLIKAVQKFDHTKGFKVTSFAVRWIRQAILDALMLEGKIVRIPQNRQLEVSKLNEAERVLFQELEREPSTEELEEAIGKRSSEKVEQLMAESSKPVRADSTNEDGMPLSEQLFVTEDKEPLLGEDRKVVAENALSKLTEREAKIFRLYYGIGKRPHSKYEIAIMTGRSYEWVRKKLIRTLKKLRKELEEERILEHL